MSSLPSTCRTIGAELAAARGARGLSEEAMARQLMLSKRQLVSLEQAELTGFYGLSYYRMALRKYMDALGLPTERLSRIDWSGADPVPSGGLSEPSIPVDDDSSRSRVPAAAAVVLVVLSATGYLFWTSRPAWVAMPSSDISVSELPAIPDASPAPLPTESPETQEAPTAESTEPWPAQTSSTESGPSADAEPPPPPADPVPVSAQARDASLEGIRLTVTGTTWVFVRFEDNSTLEQGIAGGSSLELERYPVYLAVGATDGVTLVVDGRRVPLAPYARNGQIRLSRQQLAALRP
jgi:cytoskeletal protein RodZ